MKLSALLAELPIDALGQRRQFGDGESELDDLAPIATAFLPPEQTSLLACWSWGAGMSAIGGEGMIRPKTLR
jgi:hypothetical protein